MKKFLFIFFIFSFLVLPNISLAQFGNSPEDPDFVDPPAPLPSRYLTPNFGVAPTVTPNSPSYNQCYSDMDSIGDVICRIGELLNSIIPVLIALGVVYFVFGVVQYFIGDSEEAKSKGKDRIIYGIVGLTIIVGLWGLVALVVNTFDLNQTAPAINLTNFGGQATQSSGFCTLGGNPNLQKVLGYVTCIITKSVIPLIFVLAVAAFVWGVVQYLLLGGDSDEKREQGRQFMLWGIIALTVMIGVWGLVGIVANTFNIENVIPQVKGR